MRIRRAVCPLAFCETDKWHRGMDDISPLAGLDFSRRIPSHDIAMPQQELDLRSAIPD